MIGKKSADFTDNSEKKTVTTKTILGRLHQGLIEKMREGWGRCPPQANQLFYYSQSAVDLQTGFDQLLITWLGKNQLISPSKSAVHLRPNLDIPFIMDFAFCIIGGTLFFFGADGRLACPAVGSETCGAQFCQVFFISFNGVGIFCLRFFFTLANKYFIFFPLRKGENMKKCFQYFLF